MTAFLTREHIITAGSVACDWPVEIGDYGLLDAAIARPQATVFGVDDEVAPTRPAYPSGLAVAEPWSTW